MFASRRTVAGRSQRPASFFVRISDFLLTRHAPADDQSLARGWRQGDKWPQTSIDRFVSWTAYDRRSVSVITAGGRRRRMPDGSAGTWGITACGIRRRRWRRFSVVSMAPLLFRDISCDARSQCKAKSPGCVAAKARPAGRSERC